LRDQNDVLHRKLPFVCTGNAMDTVFTVQWLLTYAEDLPNDAKARYREKLEVIGGNDPFLSGQIGKLVDCLPYVESSDLVSYLVLQTNFISAKQFND